MANRPMATGPTSVNGIHPMGSLLHSCRIKSPHPHSSARDLRLIDAWLRFLNRVQLIAGRQRLRSEWQRKFLLPYEAARSRCLKLVCGHFVQLAVARGLQPEWLVTRFPGLPSVWG